MIGLGLLNFVSYIGIHSYNIYTYPDFTNNNLWYRGIDSVDNMLYYLLHLVGIIMFALFVGITIELKEKDKILKYLKFLQPVIIS